MEIKNEGNIKEKQSSNHMKTNQKGRRSNPGNPNQKGTEKIKDITQIKKILTKWDTQIEKTNIEVIEENKK